jgi:microcystin-dependent protein
MQPYTGEIRMFAGNFAPVGWEHCDGRLLPISEYETLFNLIGTTYGGDGESTFALPDLQGRVPIHQGQGPGLSQSYTLAEMGGAESVTLTTQQMPSHTHPYTVSAAPGNDPNAAGHVIASPPGVTAFIRENPTVPMAASTLTPAGGSQPHENLMPVLGVTFIISVFGVFPRSS